MTGPEWLLATALAFWLLLSIIGQFDSAWLRLLRKYDVLGLLPMWWFFAPIPGRHDFHLLLRDRLLNGSVTAWKELPVNPERHWWNFIWNPERRQRKSFLDLAVELTHLAAVVRLPPKQIELTEAYLAFLHFISRRPRAQESVQTQFLLMTTDFDSESDRTPKAVFISSFHTMDSEAA
jgi:hypothetical protein